ncbi:MAG TPA: hypothetical protein DCY07_00550 [Rhodospirillaceae bacterium]|nr:hypothetical protein [Rhodospirillaceae bacterium]
MLSAFSSAIMLFGLSFIYGASGGTGFVDTARVLAESQTLPIGIVAGLGFVLTGFAFKISAVPFHMWTPDVYEGAPTPVTAFLAAAPKVAALALLAIILALPLALAAAVWKPVIIILSVASMVFGSFAGLMQTNLKRLMAYSAIANVGTIMVGLVCLDPMQGVICLDGLRGILIYLALYFVGVIGVFSVLLVLRKDGEPVEALTDLAGLSKTQPLLALAMAASLFSLAGVPPLAGFFGKYFVLLAAVKAGVWPLALVGVLTSVVAAGYYLRIVKIMYFDDAEASALDPVKDTALKAVVVLVSLSVLLFVLVPAPLMDAARHAAEGLLPP